MDKCPPQRMTVTCTPTLSPTQPTLPGNCPVILSCQTVQMTMQNLIQTGDKLSYPPPLSQIIFTHRPSPLCPPSPRLTGQGNHSYNIPPLPIMTIKTGYGRLRTNNLFPQVTQLVLLHHLLLLQTFFTPSQTSQT